MSSTFNQCIRKNNRWTDKYINVKKKILKKSRLILFHFHLSGYVNKEVLVNGFIGFGVKKTLTMCIKNLRSVKVTVWRAMIHACIIGQYFFKDRHDSVININGECYNYMFNTFHSWFRSSRPVRNVDATGQCYLTRSMTVYGKCPPTLPRDPISQFGDINWPQRTPADCFLWGYLKEKVYTNKPRTINALKDEIRREIAAISVHLLHHTILQLKERVQECSCCNGGHLIFKT